MSVPLTGAGSWSVRLGHEFGGAADAIAFAGGPATSRVLSGASLATREITTVPGDYAAGTALPQIITVNPNITAQLGVYQTALAGIVKDAATEAANTTRAMWGLDQLGISSNAPLATLLTATLQQSIVGLINQMTVAGTSVQSGTLAAGAQTNVGTPTGNPTIVVSMKLGNGVALALCPPETLTFAVTKDSLTGGTLLGNEILSAVGLPAVTDATAFNWPGGSGANATLAAVRGDINYTGQAGNLLINGNFQVYTNLNVPDQWTPVIGVVGTAILNGGATGYLTSPANSVEFVGDSATLTCITQAFNTGPEPGVGLGGTNATLAPDTTYHVCLFYKLSAGSPAAGTLEIALVDGSAGIGVVINDDQANANSVTKTLNPVADTLWHALTLVIHTPENMPTTVPYARLRIRLSVALTTGTNIFISNVTMQQATQLYAGGPFATVHAGSTRMLDGLTPDTWTVAITNNYATSGSGLYHYWLERAFAASGFSLRANNLQMPISGSPTILDTCVA
jgi:hypothetical protein